MAFSLLRTSEHSQSVSWNRHGLVIWKGEFMFHLGAFTTLADALRHLLGLY